MRERSDLEFRACLPGDVPELVELVKREWREGERRLLPPVVVETLERDYTFEAYVGDNAEHFLLALAGGRVVGYAFSRDDQVVGLGVEPALKRQGIGRSIMRQTEERIRRRGHRFVAVEVYEVNHAARAFYAALGYLERARSTADDYGAPLTTIALAKSLS